MSNFFDRVSGAPISWGVSEQPSWGARLDSERVLDELESVGLKAIELGDTGFFPIDPLETKALLDERGVTMVGGFVPLVLHDPARRADALERAEKQAREFQAMGATMFVTAVVEEYDWRKPTPVDREGMEEIARGLKQVDEIVAKYGVTQVLHPHVNTLVETKHDVDLALEVCDVKWCLDTGHLAIGGTDPVQFARDNADRVAHAHLKDARLDVAARVLTRELDMRTGSDAGLFQPFGQGDVAIDEVVFSLENAGYSGWYVMEQDTALNFEPAPGEGPIEDLRASLDYLRERVVPKLGA